MLREDQTLISCEVVATHLWVDSPKAHEQALCLLNFDVPFTRPSIRCGHLVPIFVHLEVGCIWLVFLIYRKPASACVQIRSLRQQFIGSVLSRRCQSLSSYVSSAFARPRNLARPS